MKTTKTLFGILTITSLILAFAGCGRKTDEQSPAAQPVQPPQATNPIQEAKSTETIATAPPVDENNIIVLPDKSPAAGNVMTLKKINEWILTGDLSPTDTYYYVQDVDAPTNSEKLLSSISGVVKILNPTSATFSPSDVLLSALRRGNDSGSATQYWVVVAQLKNSGNTPDEDALLWRFTIPNPDNLMAVQLPQPSEPHHCYLDQRLAVVAVGNSLIALDLMTGNVAWTKQFTFDQSAYSASSEFIFSFVEPAYILAQNQSVIRGLEVTNGTELWNIKWNEGRKNGSDANMLDTGSDFIGVVNNVGYLFNDNPPAISSLNLKDGTTRNVILLPPNSRMFQGQDTKDAGRYQCFLLTPTDEPPVIALDEKNTGLQLYSLTDGKLLWEKPTNKSIRTSLKGK